KTEWIPVVSAGLAVGFLAALFVAPVGRPYLGLCAGVVALQAAVGLLGFWFHGAAGLHGEVPALLESLIYGARVLAPLLFVDLALLGFIGLWGLRAHVPAAAPAGGTAHEPEVA